MNAIDFHLMRDVLDHEIVDVDGVSCGMVDEIELEINSSGRLVVAALLVGVGGWMARLPALAMFACGVLLGRRKVRVPFAEVDHIAETIVLKCKASALQLGRVDRKVGSWLSHLPKS